jgi:heat-inducible transcriptional repressor
MEFNERKRKILQAIVDDYIRTAEPVGSSYLLGNHDLGVSSATIRNEMAALEESGYLDKPHTSAGRVPRKEAYKLYVGDLGDGNALTDAETAFIRKRFEEKLGEVGDITRQAAKIISDVTNYTSFLVTKSNPHVVIEEIKLISLKGNRALLLIVTDSGVLADKTIDVSEDTRGEYLETATHMLNKVFAGKEIGEFESLNFMEDIEMEMESYKDIFDEVIQIIKNYMNSHSDNVVVEGALKMLDYPEYNNVEDAKNFLSVISDEQSVSEIFGSQEDSIEFSVRIGKEDSGVDKCAIITAAYKVGDEVVGQAGVIGPERMDYKRVIGVLDYIKNTLNSILDNKKD